MLNISSIFNASAQACSIPLQPYKDAEISSFVTQHLENLNNTLYIRFYKHDYEGQRQFAIERGIDADKADMPSFLRVRITELLDPNCKDKIIAYIGKTAEEFLKVCAENPPNAHAAEHKKMIGEIAADPGACYDRLKSRIAHYGPLMMRYLRQGDEKRAKDFAVHFKTLPPWAQVLLVESDTVLRNANGSRFIATPGMGEQGGLTGLWWKLFGAGGTFDQTGTVTTKNGKIAHRDTIDWSGSSGWDTFLHEEGHRLSYRSAEYLKQAGEGRADLNSANPDWGSAVGARKFHLNRRSLALSAHLSMYPPEDQAEEALAEMTRYYFRSYARNNRDAAAIDRDLRGAQPDIWPVFQNKMLPLYISMAEKQYEAVKLRRSVAHAGITPAVNRPSARM